MRGTADAAGGAALILRPGRMWWRSGGLERPASSWAWWPDYGEVDGRVVRCRWRLVLIRSQPLIARGSRSAAITLQLLTIMCRGYYRILGRLSAGRIAVIVRRVGIREASSSWFRFLQPQCEIWNRNFAFAFVSYLLLLHSVIHFGHLIFSQASYLSPTCFIYLSIDCAWGLNHTVANTILYSGLYLNIYSSYILSICVFISLSFSFRTFLILMECKNLV